MNKKIILFILGIALFVGLAYMIYDMNSQTTPPWLRKKKTAILDTSKHKIAMDIVFFTDTLSYNYLPKNKESSAEIAQKFNLLAENLKKDSKKNVFFIKLRAIHQIQKNDNLAKISKIYQIESQDILRANDLKNADQIFEKQELLIPVAKK